MLNFHQPPESTRDMAVAILLAMFGFFVHNWREFGPDHLLDPGTFTVLGLAISAGLFFVWWCAPDWRRASLIGMLIWASLNLIGGGILSVLPIGLFPYTPDQSPEHYLSHIIYSVAQLPLLWASVRGLRA